jgi:hypothetical protein
MANECSVVLARDKSPEARMHSLIYLVGLIVVVLAVLSLFGLA